MAHISIVDPLDECAVVYQRLFDIVNRALARQYAALLDDATVAAGLMLRDEGQRWEAELYTRRVVGFLCQQ